jgi:hypothetical protein
MTQKERIAYNESFFRDLNERKAAWLKDGLQAAGFRCECWRMDCVARIQLSSQEWEEVRSRATCFAVAPGHTGAEHEQVLRRYPHFWIIEKHDEAGEVAAKQE